MSCCCVEWRVTETGDKGGRVLWDVDQAVEGVYRGSGGGKGGIVSSI
jgi:hypothetical protein